MLRHVAFVGLDACKDVLDGPVIVLGPELPRQRIAVILEEMLQDREVEIKTASPDPERILVVGAEVRNEPVFEFADSLGRFGLSGKRFFEGFVALATPKIHRRLVIGESVGVHLGGVETHIEFHRIAEPVESVSAEAQHLAAGVLSGRFNVNHQLVLHFLFSLKVLILFLSLSIFCCSFSL